ncbi:MAG: hypothetical protein J2P37_14970 [Ktedonobacteraceae bacterium]|nr:hypothetical protein [Ktedonobacteraceae bacterium]MBO0793295.1 hypothetical protein [Ktedonobacteraceae bacterium]
MTQSAYSLQNEQFSPEAFQVASAYQLGEPQEAFHVKHTVTTVAWGIGTAVGGATMIFSALQTIGSTGEGPGFILVLAMGILLLILSILTWLLPLFYRSWHIYVCSNGFLFMHGQQIEVSRWDQIEAIWQRMKIDHRNGTNTITSYKYTIRRQDGAQIVLTSRFRNIARFGQRLRQEVTNCLLPRAIDEYNAGQTLTFGPLSINSAGISNGKNLLPWQQIKSVDEKDSTLWIKKAGKWLDWANIQIAKIPNFCVFMALVRHVQSTSCRAAINRRHYAAALV